jgi:hypothetical protein
MIVQMRDIKRQTYYFDEIGVTVGTRQAMIFSPPLIATFMAEDHISCASVIVRLRHDGRHGEKEKRCEKDYESIEPQKAR